MNERTASLNASWSLVKMSRCIDRPLRLTMTVQREGNTRAGEAEHCARDADGSKRADTAWATPPHRGKYRDVTVGGCPGTRTRSLADTRDPAASSRGRR